MTFTILINLSNHPSDKWSPSQVDAAKNHFGEVIDLPFPDVNPDGDEEYIDQLAEEYTQKVLAMISCQEEVVVHLMGEMNLTFALIQKLQTYHIKCVASTTRRNVTIREDNTKEVKFDFVKFRFYEFR